MRNVKYVSKVFLSRLMRTMFKNFLHLAETLLMLGYLLEMMENQEDLLSLSSANDHHSTKL